MQIKNQKRAGHSLFEQEGELGKRQAQIQKTSTCNPVEIQEFDFEAAIMKFNFEGPEYRIKE